MPLLIITVTKLYNEIKITVRVVNVILKRTFCTILVNMKKKFLFYLFAEKKFSLAATHTLRFITQNNILTKRTSGFSKVPLFYSI